MSGPPSSDTLKRWHDRIESMLSSVVREADSMCDCQSNAADSLRSLADMHTSDTLKEIHEAYIDALHLEVRK